MKRVANFLLYHRTNYLLPASKPLMSIDTTRTSPFTTTERTVKLSKLIIFLYNLFIMRVFKQITLGLSILF